MKTHPIQWVAALAAGVVLLSSETSAVRAAETNSESVGIYDSRVVAYAHFLSEGHMRQLNAKIQAARDAQAAGETNLLNKLSAELREAQRQAHLQVFSTAPIDDVLAEISARLPAIEQQAGVSALISKWDDAGLKQHANARQVDVTEALSREFLTPNDKQQKMMDSIARAKPVPLVEMEKMKDE